MSNRSTSKLDRSAVPAMDADLVLSREELDNECLVPDSRSEARDNEAEMLVETSNNWVHRAGWHSFVNQSRSILDAEALLILDLVPGEGPTRVIAQSLSDACSIQYPPCEIPGFITDIPVLSETTPIQLKFSQAMGNSFLAFRHLKGTVLSSRKGVPVGVLIAGYNDEDLGEDPTFDSVLSLVATLVTTQVEFEKEISSRKEIESMLRQSQKLTSVGRLATGIAHDFNNLLTVIQGHTSLLEMSVEDAGNEKAMESLGLIRSASQQAVELSKQLLLFSRQQSVNLERCDLNTVVSDFVKMMRRMVEETIELKVELGDGLDQIEADRSMLGQVMMNLIVNARDAMPHGGDITISTGIHSLSENDGSMSAGNYALLKISDTGSGIPSDKLPKIFDPFFTTKEKGKGTGLGLANVAAIIREHGGQIDVSSRPGRGTTFEILLPMVVGRVVKPAPTNQNSKEKESIRGTTILLVEDEAAVRKLVRKLLEMLGCKVIEAPSGRQALEMWPEIAEEVTLVVTDIVMPEGVSGWDLTRTLHESHPELGILLTSGYNERPEDHGMDNEKQIAFLQKPYEAKNLKQTLFRLLHPELED